MDSIVTINLPEETRAELEEIVNEEDMTPEEVVIAALKDYLFIRRFRALRERASAEAAQTYSEEEILKTVSWNSCLILTDDDNILATAIEGKCSCIITGDSDLLVIKIYKGIKILTPSDFLAAENLEWKKFLSLRNI